MPGPDLPAPDQPSDSDATPSTTPRVVSMVSAAASHGYTVADRERDCRGWVEAEGFEVDLVLDRAAEHALAAALWRIRPGDAKVLLAPTMAHIVPEADKRGLTRLLVRACAGEVRTLDEPRPSRQERDPSAIPPAGEPFTVDALLQRWPTAVEKTELVRGVLLFTGAFDERDIATAQRTYPVRRILLNAHGGIEVHPAGLGTPRSVLTPDPATPPD